MACCVVQSFCWIAAWFNCWIDHPRRREACLVGEAAVWTLSGVWCANLDVFWQRFFALVFQLGQSITPITPKVGVKAYHRSHGPRGANSSRKFSPLSS